PQFPTQTREPPIVKRPSQPSVGSDDHHATVAPRMPAVTMTAVPRTVMATAASMLGIGAAPIRCDQRRLPPGVSFQITAVPLIGAVSCRIARFAPQPATYRFPAPPTEMP